LGICIWTYTDKGTYTRALCQKNEGHVEIKQRPTKTGGLEEDESATHILCDCEAVAHVIFHHLGQFFIKPSDYYDAPYTKSYTLFEVCD
jgi:hypothetical protein